jgi:DNA repair exonuclease SbcCD ATPase subunit
MRNIFSYGNKVTKIPLDFEEPVLIVGENHDSMINGEFDANGAGKSSILNALLYVLYNKTLNKVKLDDLINNINKKNLYVGLILEDGGVYYKIERWRKNKKLGGSGNNGVRISQGDSIASISTNKTPASSNVDEYIQNEILNGMPFDLAIRIMAYSAKSDSFLSLPATSANGVSQVSILEEIFGQKVLTERGNKLKELIKETKTEIDRLKDLAQRIRDERGRYEEQLKMAEASISTWDEAREHEISTIKSLIAELKKIDFASEFEIIKARDELEGERLKASEAVISIIADLNRQRQQKDAFTEWKDSHAKSLESTREKLTEFDRIDYEIEKIHLQEIDRISKELDELKVQKKDVESEVTRLVNEVKELESEITILKESKCPYCEQEYHDNKGKIDNKISQQKKLAVEYNEKNKILKSVVDKIEDYSAEYVGLFSMFKDMAEWQKSKSEYDRISDELERMNGEENPYKNIVCSDEEIAELTEKKEALSQLVSELQNRVDEMKSPHTLEDLYQKQAELQRLEKSLIEKSNDPNPHKETVEQLKKVFKNLEDIPTDKIEELESDLKHQNFLLKLLMKKDSFIRQALLDANLPLLNTRLQYYLEFIGLPHKVMFTKDMAISISQFNNQIGYANLSGGQQARINLAIAFAFRDVVQARHQKINLCILDECLDLGLSNLGIKQAAKMIKDVAKENELSMYVITHRDEIQKSFDKQLKAILKGGLTEVEII